jgi:hypothetical protein
MINARAAIGKIKNTELRIFSGRSTSNTAPIIKMTPGMVKNSIIVVDVAVYNVFSNKFGNIDDDDTAHKPKKGIKSRNGVPPMAVIIRQIGELKYQSYQKQKS